MTTTIRRARVVLARACLAVAWLAASKAGAQTSPAPLDSSARTMGDLVDTLRAAAGRANFANQLPSVNASLDSLADCFSRGGTRSLSLEDAAGVFKPTGATGALTIARWYRSPCSRATPVTLGSALSSLLIIANGSLHGMMEPPTQAWVDAFVADMNRIVLTNARNANQAILAREAAKYGPGSAQLNVAEVGLNYVVQLLPGVRRWFLPSSATGPTPNELVAAYRTTDLTAAQAATGHVTGRIVSAAEIGLRRYTFSPSCGQGPTFVRLFHPCSWSTGLYVMAPRDVPLARVWGKDVRAGMFVALSGYHLGCTLGVERRCAVGLATQVLPYLF